MKGKRRIEFEDDLVQVMNIKTKEIVYSGWEDYEPMKYENWRWDDKKKAYFFGDYMKVCVG